MTEKNTPELLVPAGSLEVLKVAVRFGADAVYIGGEAFGLRAKAKNFSAEDMKTGIAYAHANGAKVYVTANIFAHNADLEGARAYFEELKGIRPDALIISDPGMFTLAREICPEIDIHISTQANNTNYMTARFWGGLGATRIVSARELSMAELKTLKENMPEKMELETFVHGSMCISYSGRCLLSNFLTGRDANRGACTHPCRWNYKLLKDVTKEHFLDGFVLEEESRPGEYFPVYENERGTYIFNSKDLCMIGHIPEMVDAGIDSYKIEGRMKNALYVATVARTYRKAIDDYFTDPALYERNLSWYAEQISNCTYREFTTGFFFGKPSDKDQIYEENTYKKEAVYLGYVRGFDENGRVLVEQKNKFCKGDIIEIMKPSGENLSAEVLGIFDDDGNEQGSAPHSRQLLHLELEKTPDELDVLRAPVR